jgi:HSP20 family protein
VFHGGATPSFGEREKKFPAATAQRATVLRSDFCALETSRAGGAICRTQPRGIARAAVSHAKFFIKPTNPSEHITMRIVRYTYPQYRSFTPALGGFARSPWSGLESEIDRLFATTLGDVGSAAPTTRFPVDLYEDQDNTYVRAELPGVNREAINVEVVDGYLTINASHKTPAADPSTGSGQVAKPEESFSFSRSINLNDSVQADKVSAAYENGVLTITLPKREEAKPKKVTVAVK